MPIKDPVKRAAYKADWARRKLLADPAGVRERNRLRQKRWQENNPTAYRYIYTAYKARNRGRLNETQRDFRAKNPRHAADARMKSYYANPELHRARAKKWRAENPEVMQEISKRWRLDNAEAIKEARRQWREENRGTVRSQIAKRRATKRHATPDWLTAKDWLRIRDIYARAERLSLRHGKPYVVDHICPLMGDLVCGLHVPNNLRAIAKAANSRKSNKWDYRFDFQRTRSPRSS